MASKLLLGIFFIGITLTLGDSTHESSSSEESSEEVAHDDHNHGHGHGHGHHSRHHDKCRGLEDVDLSDLNLEMDDLRKLVSKDENKEKIEGQKFPYLDGAEVSLNDIKTTVGENGMGVVRKVVVLSNKKRIFAKVMKTSQASGQFMTSVSGSMNTSVDANTSGKAKFGVDLQIFTMNQTPHNSINGDATIVANSSTAWIKKGKVNILQTKSTSSSASKISWSDASSSIDTAGSMSTNSTASSTSGTVILSKKCFATKVGLGFNASSAGSGWTSSIVGKGKGAVFTRILFATQNGTSVAWTFAKLTIKTHLEIKGGNSTIDGTQYITVKSFTETITRPTNPTAANADRKLEVSNEIKIRVGAKTTLNGGTKIYSTGGQILFRNSQVNIPADSTTVEGHEEEDEDGEGAGAHVMVANVLRKQVQADDLLVNPVFVNSVVASAMN